MEVLSLMTRLADELLRQDDEPAVERLLRPKAGTTITPLAADPAYIPVYAGPHYHRRAVGWLAMFNAACFFSLAILCRRNISRITSRLTSGGNAVDRRRSTNSG